ncbi:MAG: ABC transporter permease [Actinomycetota bacterium]|nr:ABC transporter permease [Actinomycetota bacterium]
MRRILVIGLLELKRIVRDRVNVFFIFVFPIILILLLGVTFGGGFVPKLGVVLEEGSPLALGVLDELRADDSLDVEVVGDAAALSDRVERGVLEAGIVVPEGYGRSLRSARGVTVRYVASPGDFSSAARAAVDSAIARHWGRVRAALVAERATPIGFDAAYEAASEAQTTYRGIGVEVTKTGGERDVASEENFQSGASTQLILFMFVTSLAASAALVQTRQYGVLRRMLAAPVRSSTILLGQAFGRFLVALVQGLFIIVAAALLFSVTWGDPVAAGAVVTLFALVATGTAMFFGSVLKNDQQASALIPFGLALAALGGCMVPLEVFPATMRTVARLTPHAWANEAFEDLLANGGTVGDILPQLAALTLFAVASLATGALMLRRALTR